MVKWGLIILSVIVGLALGGILQKEVCTISEQNLGTGTSVMKATCTILSMPIGLIILILALVGIVAYLIWGDNWF